MIQYKFGGVHFSWARIRRCWPWLLRSRYVLLPVGLMAFHGWVWSSADLSPSAIRLINVVAAVGLPVVGGMIILSSIDSSLRFTGQGSLWARFRKYFRDLPLLRWDTTVTPMSGHASVRVRSAAGLASGDDGTVEGRLARLEAQHAAILLKVEQNEKDFRAKLGEHAQRFNQDLGKVRELANHARERVDTMLRDSVPGEVMGFLFLVHGALSNAVLNIPSS